MTGRGLHGRHLARLILIAAIALDVLLALLLYVWAPGTMSPMWSEPPSRLVSFIPTAFGIALNLAGLAWMVRIVRADPEAGSSSWRAFRRR